MSVGELRKQPNILWICTDQQRYDTIHCLNNPHINTPNIDRLCADGVAFTRTYCQSPVCSPSRASFLTGLYPGYVGVNRNGLENFPDKSHVELITARLAAAGYDCGLSGKLHIASAWDGREKRTNDGYRDYHYSHAPLQGADILANDYVEWVRNSERFDEVFDMSRYNSETHKGCKYHNNIPPELHQTTWCADRAIDLIHEHAKDGPKSGQPWLYSVNIFDPHPAFDAPQEYEDRYDIDSFPPPLFRESDLVLQSRLEDAFFQGKPTEPREKQQLNKANYYGMIELIDENVGRMIDALEQTGQRRDTMIIFASDHGEMLGDHGLRGKGARFYEGAVRVPLIISWTGTFKEGLIAEGLTELNDLAPTIADVAGLSPIKSHGKSLVPILTGDADPGQNHDYVRCEYYDALDMKAPDAVEERTETWATMYLEGQWKLIAYHHLRYGELYDLHNDPNEFENLWDNALMTGKKNELIAKSFDASVKAMDTGPQLVGRY